MRFRRPFFTESKGFTLMEMMVAMSILTIMAFIVLAALDNWRRVADASQMLQQLQELEKGLKVFVLANQTIEQWPLNVHATHYTLERMITVGDGHADEWDGLNETIVRVPDLPAGGVISVDNRVGPYECNAGPQSFYSGVSIRIEGTPDGYLLELADLMDENIDYGDGADCGRVRWGGGSQALYYLIANDTFDLDI